MYTTNPRKIVLAALGLAINACVKEDPKANVPCTSAMEVARREISYLIPFEKLKEHEAQKGNEQFLSPFSRGVADIIVLLELLREDLPHSLKDETVAKECVLGITGAIHVCNLALKRNMNNDKLHIVTSHTSVV